MKFETSRFGSIEFAAADEIYIKNGIPGFDALTRYIIIPHRTENTPFCWLQSLEKADLAFVLCSPNGLVPDYKPSIDEALKDKFEIEKEDQVALFNIVSFRDGGKKAYANLCAPLIFNLTKRSAIQIILDERKFPFKFDLFAKSQDQADNEKQNSPK